MLIAIRRYKYLFVFLSFAFLILITKLAYFENPLIWDETQLLKGDVSLGKFWKFLPPFNMPVETYGHPSGIAFIQSLFVFIFGSSNIALRTLSLLMNSAVLTLIVYVYSLIGRFSAGIAAALMLMFSPLLFPSLISFLPQSYELLGGLLFLAVTYRSRGERNPYLFANVSILAIFLRETNLAFWAPYSLIYLWRWIKTKKDFPVEILVAPFLILLHFSFNYLKTDLLMPHPLLIDNDFMPQMTILEIHKVFLDVLKENTLLFSLLLLFVLSLFLLRKQKDQLIKDLFPLVLPLVLHLAFYNFYYRDFGHRDYVPTFCLLYLISVKSISMSFEKLKITKKFQILAASLGILLLFLTPSFHGRFLKSHYFRVQTDLYKKTVTKLEELEISDRTLYAPWPLSHALLFPHLNWVSSSYLIVGSYDQAEYLILTNTTPNRSFLELEQSMDWILLEKFSKEGMYVKVLKRKN